MFVQKGETFPASAILPAIQGTIERKGNKEAKADFKNFGVQWAKQLEELNDAILADRSVFAKVEKSPVNLDKGDHWFSIYYVDRNGQVSRLWLGEFGVLLGGAKQTRNPNVPYYIWKSGGYGSDRCISATDGLFVFLKGVCGTYAQLETL